MTFFKLPSSRSIKRSLAPPDDHEGHPSEHIPVREHSLHRERLMLLLGRDEHQGFHVVAEFDGWQVRLTPINGGPIRGQDGARVHTDNRQQFDVELPLLFALHQVVLDRHEIGGGEIV